MASRLTSSDGKVVACGCNLGARWTKDLMGAVPSHISRLLTRRGLAYPATSQLASRLRAELRDVWSAVGGEVDACSSSWRAFVWLKGLTKEVFFAAITQMRDWSISNSTDSSEAKWGIMSSLLRDADRRQLPVKLWLTATAKDPAASGTRRRKLAILQYANEILFISLYL